MKLRQFIKVAIMENKLHSYRTKLVIAFLLSTTIPLLIIGSIAYYTSFSIAKDKIMNTVALSNNLIMQDINDRFNQIERISDSVDLQVYKLYSTSEDPLLEYIDTFSSIRNNLASLKDTFGFYQICAFFKDDVFISNEGLMFQKINNLKMYNIHPEELMYIGTSSKWNFISDLSLPIMLSPNEREVDSILNIHSLTKNSPKSLEYVYFIAIKADELSNLLGATFDNTDITSFIMNDDGIVVAHSNSEDSGNKVDTDEFSRMTINADRSSYTYNDSQYLVNRLNNGWYLVIEIPNTYIRENTQILVNIIIIAFVILLPLTISVIIFITGSLTKKLKTLTRIVQSTQIDNNTIATQKSDKLFNFDKAHFDEIDTLAQAYESMMDTIDTSFKNILELSVQEEKLEYQLLQSQINPHFLYNILNSIHTSLSIGRADTAKQLLIDLAKFYKLTLHKSSNLITIRDELEIASLYLEMEQLCKNFRFDWKITKEQDIEKFMISKFTLQPFLENCINHGMQNITGVLHISVDLVYDNDLVKITIMDSGCGIESERLEQIQHDLKYKIVSHEKNYGISNVNARISNSLFGSGSVNIYSKAHDGTTVVIKFKQIFDLEDEIQDEEKF